MASKGVVSAGCPNRRAYGMQPKDERPSMPAAPRRRRRAIALGIVFSSAALIFPTGATALPTVTAVGRAVAIPGFPHTGNFFGAGAAVQAEVKISGTEYGGFPPPLIGITVFLPAGVKLHPQGFATCPPKTVIEEKTPEDCPKASAAGPPGKVFGVVSLGDTRVPETVELRSYFAPGGGFEFFADGHTPVSIEVAAAAALLQPNGGGGFGPEFTGKVPLVETVPGAPDASVEAIDVTIGSAYRKHGKPVYYGTVPKTCPKGGFRVKSDFTFAENGNLLTPVTVMVPFRAVCPTR
jgi:hypothetical protein